MLPNEYVKVLRMIANTLEVENRCDEHGIEVTALRECSDYFESLIDFGRHAISVFENLDKEFPSNSYRVGKISRKLIKQHHESELNLSKNK